MTYKNNYEAIKDNYGLSRKKLRAVKGLLADITVLHLRSLRVKAESGDNLDRAVRLKKFEFGQSVQFAFTLTSPYVPKPPIGAFSNYLPPDQGRRLVGIFEKYPEDRYVIYPALLHWYELAIDEAGLLASNTIRIVGLEDFQEKLTEAANNLAQVFGQSFGTSTEEIGQILNELKENQ